MSEPEIAQEVPAAETVEVVQEQQVESAPTEPVEKPTEDDPNKEPEAKKPGKNSFDRKIDRLYKANAEQKARADYLEQQLQSLIPKQQEIPGSPRIEDFDDLDKFIEAKTEFQAEQKIKGLQQDHQRELNKRSQQMLVNSWEEKSARAYDKYDDFDEVVGDIKPVNGISVAIMQADNAEDVAYYLGKNIKEAQRIAQLDPIAQIREIGRLEAKLLNEPQKAKTPSQLPEPIRPLRGSASTAKSSLEAQDYATFLKLRNKELGRK